MTAVNFGVGTVVGRRTDISNPTPSFLGILQDIEIDFDQTLKELMGQNKVAVDVAPAGLKIAGKSKFARIESSTLRDLLFGSAATVTQSSGQGFITGEPHAIPTTPYQVVVANAGQFLADQGVFYSNGKQLNVVASSPAVGQYSVSAGGTYTFAAADTGNNVTIYYSYSVTNLVQVTVANSLMGTGPSFSLFLSEQYTNNAGVLNTFNMQLNACRSSKLTFPFKNGDYTILGFDFQAFADQNGNIGTISTTE